MKKNLSPLVYIILPIYNWERYFLEQLISIYHQNYKNRYLIIVNDWSTDSSEEIASKFISDYKLKDKVKIIRKENWWLNSAITRWFEEIKNLCDIHNTDNLIAYCDCDDIWTREKLSLQVRYMIDHPNCWLTFHDASKIDENWILIKSSMLKTIYKNMIYEKNKSFIYLSTFWTYIIATEMMFKIKYIDDLLPMPLWFQDPQDYWTYLVLSLLKVEIWYIDKPLAYYRSGHSSMQKKIKAQDHVNRGKITINILKFLQKRFPNKNISTIISYNEDRLINRVDKWYCLIHIYILMLFKYPEIFWIGFKAQIYRFCRFWFKAFKPIDSI